MKKLFFLALSLLAFSSDSFGSITLRFGETGTARATGFANASGSTATPLRWGIIVDASGNGFADGSYNVFDNTTSGFLSAAGGNAAIAADDYFVPSGLFTGAASATGSDSAVTGGAITLMSSIFNSYPSGVGSGDAFKIVWFDTTPGAGTFYGTLANTGPTGTFVLPSDGADQSYANFFVGNDPTKSATLQFPGAAPIPEPSRMMLLGFGLVGLFFRRRR